MNVVDNTIGYIAFVTPVFVLLILIIAFIVGCIMIFVRYDTKAQKKSWNNGICSHSGNPWMLHQQKDNGDRVYRDSAKNQLTISTDVDGIHVR